MINKLYIFAHPTDFKDEAQAVTQLLEQVDCVFHLRKPSYSAVEYIQYLESIPKHLHKKIVMHGGYELLNDFAIKGLHFSTKNRHLTNNTMIKGTKSTGCHSLEELAECDNHYDYLFISPVFESISKPGYTSTLNHGQLNAFLQTKHKAQVIALGGITCSTLPQLSTYAFDGYAVLGAIWTNQSSPNTNIVANAKNILKWITNVPTV